jgi:hypothetical protein
VGSSPQRTDCLRLAGVSSVMLKPSNRERYPSALSRTSPARASCSRKTRPKPKAAALGSGAVSRLISPESDHRSVRIIRSR